MRLSEFTNNDEIKLQMAWQNKLSSIPVQHRNEVYRLALRHMQRGESPSDAISNAWDITKEKHRGAGTPGIPEPKRSDDKMHKRLDTKPDRVSKKSGKKWGNQYYSDPSNSDGISGAIARNRPTAIAKRAGKAASNYVGNKMDIGKAFQSRHNSKTRK